MSSTKKTRDYNDRKTRDFKDSENTRSIDRREALVRLSAIIAAAGLTKAAPAVEFIEKALLSEQERKLISHSNAERIFKIQT